MADYTARLDQLIAAGLPEELAWQVIRARKEKKFERVEDLLAIQGITPSRREMIRPNIRIGPRIPDLTAQSGSN
jgi:hypothetical protein